jgi:hypothetical protein
VIELIRPRHIAEGDIQAIFVDELNRTHKKVRNALMELIQFKTINGKPISSDLRIVWAAVNPESDDSDTNVYDVDRLDPAQRDRFQIQCELPYKPHLPYFSGKYGHEMAQAAIEYWDALPDLSKEQISPRRLDYALSVYNDGGDVRDVLPQTANATKLTQMLQNGSVKTQLQNLLTQPPANQKAFFQNDNNYARVLDTVLTKTNYRNVFLPQFPVEKIASLLSSKHKGVVFKTIDWSIKAKQASSDFFPVLEEMIKADQNKKLVAMAEFILKKNNLLATKLPKPNSVPTGSKVLGGKTLTRTILGSYHRPGGLGHGILQALDTALQLNPKELRACFHKLATSTLLTDMKKEGLIKKMGGLKSPFKITELGKKYLTERGRYTLADYNKSRTKASAFLPVLGFLPWDSSTFREIVRRGEKF